MIPPFFLCAGQNRRSARLKESGDAQFRGSQSKSLRRRTDDLFELKNRIQITDKA